MKNGKDTFYISYERYWVMKKFKAKSLYRCRILVPVRLEVSSVTTFYNFLPPATTRQQECGLTKGQNCGGLGQMELTRLILSKCNISFYLETKELLCTMYKITVVNVMLEILLLVYFSQERKSQWQTDYYFFKSIYCWATKIKICMRIMLSFNDN